MGGWYLRGRFPKNLAKTCSRAAPSIPTGGKAPDDPNELWGWRLGGRFSKNLEKTCSHAAPLIPGVGRGPVGAVRKIGPNVGRFLPNGWAEPRPADAGKTCSNAAPLIPTGGKGPDAPNEVWGGGISVGVFRKIRQKHVVTQHL